MIQSITSLTASDPVQFLNTSPHSLNQASQSVLRVLLPFLYQKSPVPEVLTLWGTCVHFSFLNSSINALLDSYPVTWLAKVVALLPPVADSFALCRSYVI